MVEEDEGERATTMWTDSLKDWTKLKNKDCIRAAQDWEQWRSTTANPLIADGT